MMPEKETLEEATFIVQSAMKAFISEEFEKYLEENGFYKAPASTKYHGAYPGGLFYHSYNVYLVLEELSKNNNLHWDNIRSTFLIGILHDVCKMNLYDKQEFGYKFNQDEGKKGHGKYSVAIIEKFIKDLTDEERNCIRYHMGAYGNDSPDEWKELGEAIKKYPNILWVHHADMIASQIYNT